MQSAERVRVVVTREDVVYVLSAERFRVVVTREIRDVVTREDVVCSQQRGSGL
jgi:hypothetical protein